MRHAIRKISCGVYQVNPKYAARGTWHYHSRKKQGGVENLLAAFSPRGREPDAGEGGAKEAERTDTLEERIRRVSDMIGSINGNEGMPPF